MMLERPLGIGAMEFGKTYGEDEHDIWLKSLTTYGWLGFAAYVSLVLWTLIAALPSALPHRSAAGNLQDRLCRACSATSCSAR